MLWKLETVRPQFDAFRRGGSDECVALSRRQHDVCVRGGKFGVMNALPFLRSRITRSLASRVMLGIEKRSSNMDDGDNYQRDINVINSHSTMYNCDVTSVLHKLDR